MVPRIERLRFECVRRSRRMFLRTCCRYYYHLNLLVRCGTKTSISTFQPESQALQLALDDVGPDSDLRFRLVLG